MKYDHMLEVTLVENRFGGLCIFGGHVQPQGLSCPRVNGRESDYYAQSEQDAKAILDDFQPKRGEGGRRNVRGNLNRGWSLHGYLPDDYADTIGIDSGATKPAFSVRRIQPGT